MASIREQTSLIFKHPYFKFALEKAAEGDLSPMERLLLEVMCHTWEKCALESSRVYGRHHRLNHMDIKRELRDMAPPTGLDLKLPVPVPCVERREMDFMIVRSEPLIIPLYERAAKAEDREEA